MTQVEITPDQIYDIDSNQVSSMQLKDGTVVVVNSEADQGDFTEEQFAEGDFTENDAIVATQDNYQLRARPILGMPVRPVVPARPGVVPVRPVVVPSRPAVVPVPVRPVVVPKPAPRGPVVRPGAPMVFRARPGMPVHMPPKMVVAPKPVVPIRPTVPVMKPVVPGLMPKPIPAAVRPAVMPVRPAVVPGRPPVFRARPNYNEEEDFQEEYAGEEDYCECDDYEGAVEENQLRARPLVAPSPITYAPGVVKPVPINHPPVRPPVVAPPRFAPVPPKRGPALVRPGYNTYQPGVFRERSRVVARPIATPMFTPLAPGYGVGRVVRPIPPPPRPYGFGMGPVFRNRPNTATYDAQEQDYTEEYVDEGCEYNTSSVCSKCGKEF